MTGEMTNKEAIWRIKDHMIVHQLNEPRAILITEALEMAIKALEQEPCEDAVSRQQFKIALLREYDIPHEVEHAPLNKGILLMKEKALEIAKDLPSVTPIRPKGEWIKFEHELVRYIECSKCTNVYRDDGYNHWNFCPNCGADMRGGKE